MDHGETPAAGRDRAGPREEGSLTPASYVGSFGTVDFRLTPLRPEVAFLGRSNVGKSSLINALLDRRSLAHVSKTPGKTRTCNVYDVDHRYYLVDLPGYGYAHASHAERQRLLDLVERYLSKRPTLRGVVWLLDVRRDPSADDLAMAERLRARQLPVLAALTKVDKVGRGRRTQRRNSIIRAVGLPEDQCVETSSHDRHGIDELRASIDAVVAA